jgi:hypothetical protein
MLPCALLVSSAHHKRNRGARSNNGRDLDKGWEKTGSRITHDNRTLKLSNSVHGMRKNFTIIFSLL